MDNDPPFIVPPPTVDGFLQFVYGFMQITPAQLPPTSPVVFFAFHSARETVNGFIRCAVPFLYHQAVYNLAADILINYAPDIGDAFGNPPPFYGTIGKDRLPVFAYLRRKFNVNGFVSGVISSASDEGTSESMVVPDSLAQLSLSDLQNMKTPWGRRYLSIAQKWGPTLFGIT
jgi:hypothetical protein